EGTVACGTSARGEVAHAARPSGRARLSHHADQHAAHERRQRVPLVLGERAQDAVEHLETGRLEPPRDTTAGRRQGHRGGAAVDARPAPHQAVLFEAVDETYRARLNEPEQLRETIDRGSVLDQVKSRKT